MDISIFLAKVIGLYMLIAGGLVFRGPSYYKQLTEDVMTQRGVLLVSGIMTLILGILMVLTHNIWVADWRVLITILSWWALIKGVLLLYFPDKLHNFAVRMQEGSAFYLLTVLVLLLGAFFCWKGFF